VIRHVVMFRFAEDAPDDIAEQFRAALATLPGIVPGILRYEFGPDAGINQGNHDFVVVADFDDRAAYLAYRDHPEHQRLIRELFAPAASARAAVQYELPG
jgi:quinol monooxygenase YgiN